MKFSTTCGGLLKVLSKVNAVVPSKSPLPILDHILFDVSGSTLTLTATNLEITMFVSLGVKGNSNGKIAVPAQLFTNTISALPQNTNVTFSADIAKRKIVLTTEKGTYHLSGQNAEDFPKTTDVSAGKEISLPSEKLQRVISKTSFAASADELRPSMTGVLFDFGGNELRCVATDGHRLVKMTLQSIGSKEKREVIIPQRALSILNRSLDEADCAMSFDDQQAKFSFGTTTMYTRLITDKYPNYDAVIPTDNDKEMRVNREDILASVRRVGFYTSQDTKQIRMALKRNQLTVAAEDVGLSGGNASANEELACEYTSEAMDIGFNAVYVSDILSHLDGEEMIFTFSSPTRATMAKPAKNEEKEEILMLVMPVRLNS
ncbi:MAG: DNA polymerase III subunit beta [Ignavibacteriales bacterium]|nr:DNA polymerase III subunit beta [Ignavibacteriales bacterium]